VVSYRDYLKEIESFIEQNMLDQVISHSSHILKSYPNSIDAIRFLGQAYLEEKKFREAAISLERLLSYVPDDFVAHVGISSIKEEDRDLEGAIFHMEMAFDSQPSNVIVQEELKRLINKRDGIKPQKINLSKGALIRMYIKGDLFQQALNEIKATLETSPERIDIKVLLAKVYAQSNAKVQAVEVCNQILELLPFCLEANQILHQIYLENGLTEQATQVQERLISLDPYYKYVTSTPSKVEDIPNSKVEIEKLEYTSAFSSSPQEYWFPPEIETNPSPLISKSSENDEKNKEKSILQNNPPDLIPDFLSNAGWEKSENPQTESSEFFDSSSDTYSDSPADKSELPEWLKNYKPTVGFTEGESNSSAVIQDPLSIINEAEHNEDTVSNIDIIPVDTLSFISEVEMTADNPHPTPSNDDSSDWMSQFFDEANKSSLEPESEKVLPDWLKSFGQDNIPAETNAEDEVPDWLKNLDSQIVQNESLDTKIEQKQETPSDFIDLSSLSAENSPFSFEAKIPADVVFESTQDNIISIEPDANDEDFLNLFENSSSEGQKIEPTPSTFLEEEIVTTQLSTDNSESTLPDWVKSVLSEPDEITPEIQVPIDSLPNVTDESLDLPVSDISSTSSPEAAIETTEGAISQDASDELLEWLRGINPDQSEVTSADEFENKITADTSSTPEILEESLNRLEEISGNSPEITQGSTIKPDEVEPSPSAEEPKPEVPKLLGIEEEIEVEPSIMDVVKEVDLQEADVYPSLLEKLQSLLSSSSYTEATSLIAELKSAGFDANRILETISSYKNERISDFDFFQFSGDTLAGFDHFDEAMEMYTQAEKILLGK